jgi:DNA-binding beta-propeller fold protein YncE
MSMRALRVQGGMISRVAGVLLTLVGSHSGFGGSAVNARFYENCGIAVDPDGNLLIAMMEDNRVALVDAAGSVINIGGTGEGPGGSAGLGDGVPATLERINTPEDVAVAGRHGLRVRPRNHTIQSCGASHSGRLLAVERVQPSGIRP